MSTTERKRGQKKKESDRKSISRLLLTWISPITAAIMTVLYVLNTLGLFPPLPNQPPVIQNGIQLSRDTVPVGETVDAWVIVKDPNLPKDKIRYDWGAHLGTIGEQLNRFQEPETTYVPPDQPGLDFITVTVYDQEGETAKDFRPIRITERRKKQIIVGNKNFTEQHIVGELMKQLLEDRGFAVKLDSDLYSSVLRRGMEDGAIDICADYTGTAWMTHLKHEYEPGMDNNELYRMVKEADEKNGLIWLKPVWNNNTYALASWPEFVEEHGLKTLSDLASLYREKEGEIKTFVDPDFVMRPDGLPGLERYYNFKVAEASVLIGKPGDSLQALAEHKVEVAMVFGTDAEIAKHGWHVYMDDKAFFPPYDLTPYVRQEVLDEYPEIVDILNELVATFPGGGGPASPEIVGKCQKVWQELNAKVNIYGMESAEVAREYLLKHGLIKE